MTKLLKADLHVHTKYSMDCNMPLEKIINTDPGFKGDTATGGNKPATLETGITIQVPLFVNTGDVIKVDTRTGSYLERTS